MSTDSPPKQKLTVSFLGTKIVAEGTDAIKIARVFATSLWSVALGLTILLAFSHWDLAEGLWHLVRSIKPL